MGEKPVTLTVRPDLLPAERTHRRSSWQASVAHSVVTSRSLVPSVRTGARDRALRPLTSRCPRTRDRRTALPRSRAHRLACPSPNLLYYRNFEIRQLVYYVLTLMPRSVP